MLQTSYRNLTRALLASLTRKVMKDITLSDGTFLPKGTLVVAAAHSTHRDEVNYTDAETFDPFRFSKLREGEGEGLKHQFVNTSLDYISFGHGRHAWCVAYISSGLCTN